MPRRNSNATRTTKRQKIKPNLHMAYSPDELYESTVIVRYMGETQGDLLKCYHPEGYEFWAHVSQVYVPRRKERA